jgi:hypothetical protein
VQKKADQFTNHTKYSDQENLARRIALFKTFRGERTWKAIRDRLRKPCYLNRVDHVPKIRTGSKESISGSIPL